MLPKPIAFAGLLLLLAAGCTAPTPSPTDTPVFIQNSTPAAAPSATIVHQAVASPIATPTPTPIILAREATPAAGGETWKGAMESKGELQVSNNPCHDAFDTVLELTVQSDGRVTGTGHATATATVPTTCTLQPPQPPVTAVTLEIEGLKKPDRLELRLFPTAVTGMIEAGFFANWMGPGGVEPPIQVVPIVRPGRAEGVVDITDASRFKAGTTHNTYRLDCTNCK